MSHRFTPRRQAWRVTALLTVVLMACLVGVVVAVIRTVAGGGGAVSTGPAVGGAAAGGGGAAAGRDSPAPGSPAPSRPARANAPPEPPRCTAAEAIEALPIRHRLAQLLMVGVDGDSAAEARDVMLDERVGGIVLTGDGTGLLTGGALDRLQQQVAIPVAVAVDDEGGRVEHFDELAGELPSAREMARTMTPQQVYRLARQRGELMHDLGVTVNLAPVLDVSDQPDGGAIGDRSFSDDPAVVTRYAGAFAMGLRDAGVLPVFKHFPGHGRARGDSHEGAVTTPPLDELRGHDLLPYRRLLGPRSAVMLGHLDVPGLTEPGTPVTISPAALRLLRGQLGFDGLVLTDDLVAMEAITDRLELTAAVRLALAAGADMAMWVSHEQVDEVLDHLERSVADGSLPVPRVNEAVGHVLAAKGVDPCTLRG